MNAERTIEAHSDRPSRSRSPARLTPWLAWGAAVCLLGGLGVGSARGQVTVRNITQPIPVVNTGGHGAPVRSLIFVPPDGSFLLSGGMDKIVNVWDLRGPHPGLAQTIRPRLWRGYAGVIYAMALSPAGADGQRVLAVAGYGVENNRGEINLFRFPGANNRPTGDLIGQLPCGKGEDREPAGHVNNVTCLAFDPTGTLLASGSHDSTVRIWNVANRTTIAVLRGHTQNTAVNALAFTPDGQRLVSGGQDGQVILWDVAQRRELARARPDPAQFQNGLERAAISMNLLAVSPDGLWVVIGRENGNLVRYDAATLLNPALLNPRDPNAHGAVESLAISPDGTMLAYSVVSSAIQSGAERPRLDCDVMLRRMPDGQLPRRVGRASNLVYASAFSPDSRRLAYAGGDLQGITVIDLTDPRIAPVELTGQGSSIWDVGFAADSRAIGFARQRPDLPEPPELYEDFDLQGQRVAPFARNELSRAVLTWNGWRIEPKTPYRVDALNAQNQGWRLDLDPSFDRRWWSYSFIPPGPGHPRPAIAVGCEAGVAIYRLDTGKRTRLYAGHSGAVYALAPSPDGKWLVTGSVDQTVRFWRLAGCDTLAPLGAEFGPSEQGIGKVTAVERGGFADSGGLQVGDVIEQFYIVMKEGKDLKALETVLPDIPIAFRIRRKGEALVAGSTKRDPPALTLFPARDREWIVWTPSGYYETSPIGDRKYLGWHRNRESALQPTDYFAFDHFEKELRQPKTLLRFLQTADRDVLHPEPAAAPVVARAPEQILVEDRLPRVELPAPARPVFDPLLVQGAGLPIRVRAMTEDAVAGRGLIQQLRVLIDSERFADLPINPPAAVVDRPVNLNLNPGRHRVSVVAVNDRGKERTESFDLIAQELPAPVAPVAELPRLIVLAVGVDPFPKNPRAFPLIPFAAEDARDVGQFLAAPNGSPRFQRVDVQRLLGPEATSGRILAALEALDERRRKGELGKGDSVLVLIESHFLSFDSQGVVLGADASPDKREAPAARADRITETLGQLADYGCKVMLLVDAVHEKRPQAQKGNRGMNEWARQLYHRNVITFVASIHGPSQRHLTHGVFAEAILRSMNVQGNARLSESAQGPFTLFDFQDGVARNVLALTNRQQHARCYIPDTIPSQIPAFDPPARRQPRELRAARD